MQTGGSGARSSKGWYAVSVLFLLCFFVLLFLVAAGKTQTLDQQITDWFVAHRVPGMNTFMEAVTHSGDWETTTCLCLILLAFSKYRFRIGVPVSVAALITTAVKAVVKITLDRPRPPEILHLISQGGYSFPSGHAITTMAVYLLLGVLLWHFFVRGDAAMEAEPAAGEARAATADHAKAKYQIVGALCVLAAFGIGISRVYVGVHFLSDVLAGWCFGLATFAAIYGWILNSGYDDEVVRAWLAERFHRAGTENNADNKADSNADSKTDAEAETEEETNDE